MKSAFKRVGLAVAVLLAAILLFNSSWIAPTPTGAPKLLSHRGVHQTFHRDGLTNETCTAERIHPVSHTYIENTLPSIQAAFELGADMVEIDIRRTGDDQFAVFHDQMLDCRTNGAGLIKDATMDSLRVLDVGYGYTADGGRTFPLRGQGVGLMLSLDQLLRALPDRAFLINVKSNSASDADRLFEYLADQGISLNSDSALWAGPRFAERWRELSPEIRVGTRRDVKACARDYVSWGWLGHIPEACHMYGLVVPQNYTWLYWGWPRKTALRFQRESIPILLVGPLGGEHEGIDTLEQLAEIPNDYQGWIMTDAIEIVGPAILSEQRRKSN